MSTKQARGFSPVVIIVAIVAVLIVGLIAWRIYDSSQAANQANSQNPQANNNEPQQEKPAEQPAVDPNEGYVVIKEWGVRFKPVAGLEGATYFRAADTPPAYDRYDFSTQELGNRDARCKTMGFSTVTRATSPQTFYESLLAQIGEYYYYYRGSDSACGTTSATTAFESEQRNMVKESLKSLEAAK